MELLWLNLMIVFIFSLLARHFTKVDYYMSSTYFPKPNKIFLFGALTSLVTISGLRANIGDTFFYKHAYENSEFTLDLVLAEKDVGFGFLQMFLQKFISEDPQVLIFVTALITNTLIVLVLYNHSRLIDISLYVYITGGLFLVSMNGIRQVLAAAIAFVAIRYLIRGNFIKYSIIIVLASLFHQSALILIPFFFLVRFKAWSKATITLLVLSVVFVIGYEQFSNILFRAIEETQYGHYQSFSEGGANILRSAVTGVPIVIAYLGRDKLRKIMPSNDYIVNMSLIGLMFMLISTQNWIFARFSIYFELYQLILISWIIKLFREKDEKLIYFSMIICYFAYYFYESVISLNIMYRSDFLSW